MNTTTHNCEQGSDEWLKLRAGKITGTGFAKIMNRLKDGKEGAECKAYRQQMICERLTGKPTPSGFVNYAMQWGKQYEAVALAFYQEQNAHMTRYTVGFVERTDQPMGCSPDAILYSGGYQGDTTAHGLLEIKCPQAPTHLEYLRCQQLPEEYKPQVMGSMMVTGAAFCHFVSFHPEFPEALRLMVVPVQRDEEYIAMLEARADEFLASVEAEVEFFHGLAQLQ